MDERRYSIGELADLTEVSRRTVHYYVQRRLIDPPLGRGRGRHYDERHVRQIREIRDLQRLGVSLADMGQAAPVAYAEASAYEPDREREAGAGREQRKQDPFAGGEPLARELDERHLPAPEAGEPVSATESGDVAATPSELLAGKPAAPTTLPPPTAAQRARTLPPTTPVVRIRAADDVTVELTMDTRPITPALLTDLAAAVTAVLRRHRDDPEEER